VTWQVGALAAGVAGSIAAPVRVRGWLVASLVAVAALLTGIVPWSVFGDTVDALDAPLLFLALAVPLAVLLDEAGFFAAVAASVGATRRLRLALWCFAAAVTIVFNLDAAVVLLTPLYVRIAHRHRDDVVALAFIPALLASLASSVLPVSNLTNLVVAGRLHLGVGDFLVHAAPVAAVATSVGWVAFQRVSAPQPAGLPVREPVDGSALRVGAPVVGFLLLGFTAGDALGVPAWVVAAVALAWMCVVTRSLPWRHVPVHAIVLVLALGTLALGAAQSIDVERVLTVAGLPGEALAFAAMVIGANAVNNLPAVLVSLPTLDAHPARVWAVLLGANLGPTLWVTGALSTLLWQSTMTRLGQPVSARRYATVGARIGAPVLVAALAVHLALTTIT
jgi:arsenical pump membrane protein